MTAHSPPNHSSVELVGWRGGACVATECDVTEGV